MLARPEDGTIKAVQGPKTGILYHIRYDVMLKVDDFSNKVHVYITDIYNNRINNVQRVMNEDEFENLIRNKDELDKLINDILTQSEV